MQQSAPPAPMSPHPLLFCLRSSLISTKHRAAKVSSIHAHRFENKPFSVQHVESCKVRQLQTHASALDWRAPAQRYIKSSAAPPHRSISLKPSDCGALSDSYSPVFYLPFMTTIYSCLFLIIWIFKNISGFTHLRFLCLAQVKLSGYISEWSSSLCNKKHIFEIGKQDILSIVIF